MQQWTRCKARQESPSVRRREISSTGSDERPLVSGTGRLQRLRQVSDEPLTFARECDRMASHRTQAACEGQDREETGRAPAGEGPGGQGRTRSFPAQCTRLLVGPFVGLCGAARANTQPNTVPSSSQRERLVQSPSSPLYSAHIHPFTAQRPPTDSPPLTLSADVAITNAALSLAPPAAVKDACERSVHPLCLMRGEGWFSRAAGAPRPKLSTQSTVSAVASRCLSPPCAVTSAMGGATATVRCPVQADVPKAVCLDARRGSRLNAAIRRTPML